MRKEDPFQFKPYSTTTAKQELPRKSGEFVAFGNRLGTLTRGDGLKEVGELETQIAQRKGSCCDPRQGRLKLGAPATNAYKACLNRLDLKSGKHAPRISLD